MPTPESRLAFATSKDAKEKRPIAAPPIMVATVSAKAAGVFPRDAEEFSKHAGFPGQPAANVRMASANGMQQEQNVRRHAKRCRVVAADCRMHAQDGRKAAEDCRMAAKEFPLQEEVLRRPEKCPGKHANVFRMVGKVPGQAADIFPRVNPVAPKLRETHFRQTFFSRNVSGKLCKAVLSLRRLHPPPIQHTFSTFVLKRRAAVCKSAGVVLEEVPVVLLAAVGVDSGPEGDDTAAGIHIHLAVRVIPGERHGNFGIPRYARDDKVIARDDKDVAGMTRMCRGRRCLARDEMSFPGTGGFRHRAADRDRLSRSQDGFDQSVQSRVHVGGKLLA